MSGTSAACVCSWKMGSLWRQSDESVPRAAWRIRGWRLATNGPTCRMSAACVAASSSSSGSMSAVSESAERPAKW